MMTLCAQFGDKMQKLFLEISEQTLVNGVLHTLVKLFGGKMINLIPERRQEMLVFRILHILFKVNVAVFFMVNLKS